MSNNDGNNDFGLSRRKMLGGLGIVGVASAGAGLGTTAYFSDQVEFEDNELRAGTLALNVTQTIHTLDQDGRGPDEEKYFGENGEGPVMVEEPIEILDAKPGDEYKFCWEVELEGNPGFAMVKVDGVSDLTGAEVEKVFADDLYDIENDEDMVTLGEAATATAELTLCEEHDEGPATPTGEEVPIFPLAESDDNSLGALLGVLGEGLLVPSGTEEGEFCHDTECPVKLCVTIEIDTDVGNELQGAESGFNLQVHAEQCRHNDDPFQMGENGDSDDEENGDSDGDVIDDGETGGD